MKSTRTGSGPPLILVHGLGNSAQAWNPVVPGLAAQRELIVVTLPGHDGDPVGPDLGTFAGLMRSFDAFIATEGLAGVPLVGSSLGGRMVLEMARRGHRGATVALDPGGFWQGWERTFLRTSLQTMLGLVRLLGKSVKPMARTAPIRSALLAQLSAHPWKLDGELVASELVSFAATTNAAALIGDLAAIPKQEGPAGPGAGPVTIGWGRHDRLCLPVQAERAHAAFPGSTLHWFEHSGHFPMWDEPDATLKLILEATGQR
jgi:pimeloyl-ACP methyl ester carboxylesterase